MLRISRCLLPLLLVACGGHDHDHDGAGSWAQVLADGKEGMTLELDSKSDKVVVHTAPREDGGHDHISGTYTLDEATHTLTVKAKLMGNNKADTWIGKLDDKQLELSSADGKLSFKPGKADHDH